MRKIYTLLTILTFLGAYSQNEITKKVNELLAANVLFKPYSVLEFAERNHDSGISAVVEKASFATIKKEAVASLVANEDAYIEIAVPYGENNITVQLYKVDIFAEGFHLDTDQSKAIPYEQGVYYRGIVKGSSKSVAAFSFFKGELYGLVSSEILNNVVIGKLDRTNNTTDYIIYSDADLKIQSNFECHSEDIVPTPITAEQNTLNPESTRCVSMYFEIDYTLFTSNGSNTTTMTNWMTSVFNNVKTMYANDGIAVSLKSIYIWTTPDAYTGETSSDYLAMFNEMRPDFDGDVGQLVAIDSGSLGGVAKTINGLCSQNNYSYSEVSPSYNTVPTYSWTIYVITHEFGHLLGSPHTHACVWNGNNTPIDNCGPSSIGSSGEGYSCMSSPPIIPSSSVKGTIMSYCHLIGNVGINFVNGFGPQPSARLLATVNAGNCLSTDCVHTCINTAVNINVVTSGTSAVVNWAQLSASNTWQISVTPFVVAIPVWTSVPGLSYTVQNLLPNTFYKVLLRPECESSVAFENKQFIFLTDADYCNGIVITDTGGATGNHSNNESYVRTIIPNLPGKKITLTFSNFVLIGHDYLYVYDGNSTSATDLSNGGFSGSSVPGPFESTAADGSLTIQFKSDASLVRSGYIANVSCTNMLGNTSFIPNIDFTYSPNPTNGLVSISSRTSIFEVIVYNKIGQLLLRQNTNSGAAKVDLSSFSTGTYFFKIKFGAREANFKIVKN